MKKLNTSPANQRLLAFRKHGLEKRATPAEKYICSLLDELGERYLFQKGFFTENRFFIVDFYLPKRRKLCLEIDGPSHRHAFAYDEARDRFLTQSRGFRVLRITNEHAMALTSQQLLNLISPLAVSDGNDGANL